MVNAHSLKWAVTPIAIGVRILSGCGKEEASAPTASTQPTTASTIIVKPQAAGSSSVAKPSIGAAPAGAMKAPAGAMTAGGGMGGAECRYELPSPPTPLPQERSARNLVPSPWGLSIRQKSVERRQGLGMSRQTCSFEQIMELS